ENGMKFAYHNHSREFLPTEDGIVFEDELLNKTDIDLQIDTFWLFNSGIDVIAYLEAHRDRIKVIHLKDGVPSAEDKKNYDDVHSNVIGLSLGSGKAPVAAVKEWAEKNGVIMVVESEGLDPTGLEEIKRCIDYLKTLE
ncbi:MAG: sugar phosphate isomerase/epimerase, partial [Clostridia bacterium]|nr:sugar phosphate isomerase/epimerase [Clostridia bacterium]